MQRMGRSLGTLAPSLDTFDTINDVPDSYGAHSVPDANKECGCIVELLVSEDAFRIHREKRHSDSYTFKNIDGCLLHKIDKEVLVHG